MGEIENNLNSMVHYLKGLVDEKKLKVKASNFLTIGLDIYIHENSREDFITIGIINSDYDYKSFNTTKEFEDWVRKQEILFRKF